MLLLRLAQPHQTAGTKPASPLGTSVNRIRILELETILRGHLIHPSVTRQLEPLTPPYQTGVNVQCIPLKIPVGRNPTGPLYHKQASILAAFCVRKILCSDPDPTFCHTCQFPFMLSFLGRCDRQLLPMRGFILWSDKKHLWLERPSHEEVQTKPGSSRGF